MRPPAFAFVDFEDPRDADDAIYGRNGYEYDGRRIRVEPSNPNGRRDRNDDRRDDRRDRGRDYDRRDRGRGYDRRDSERGSSRPAVRHSDYRCMISNLPESASWQDLKDCMRSAGEVLFTSTDRRGNGTVEFATKEDMYRAVDQLNGTEFKNRRDTATIKYNVYFCRSLIVT